MSVYDRWHKTRPPKNAPRCDHGLVATTQHGEGHRWQVRYRDPDGVQRKRNFALKQGSDPNRHAGAFDAKMREQVNSNTYIDPDAGRVSFRDYAEQWRADQLHHRPATSEQAESRLRLHVYPHIGDEPMSAVRRSDVQRVVTIAAGKLGASTVEVMYSYVVSIFKAAVADRVIAASPCVKIKLPARTKRKVQPLTTEQAALIASRVAARYRAMVWTAAASGVRSGELRGLTVDRVSPPLHLRSDVPPKQVVLRIDRQLVGIDDDGMPVFGPVKTPAADRSVPIGAAAAKVLADHLAEVGPGNGGLVFSAPDRSPISRSRAGHIWRPAIAGMGLRPRSGWHDLRHYSASLLIADGLSVRAVADRLGHEDPAETLRTYAHLWPGDDERAVAATERVLEGVV